MSLRGLLGALALAGLWPDALWAEDATSVVKRPWLPYTVTGSVEFKQALRANMASGAWWAVLARAAASPGQPLVFDGALDHKIIPPSYGNAARGFVEAAVGVRIGEQWARITGTAETPYVVAVSDGENAHDKGFQQTEAGAVARVTPYLCGRLAAASGGAAQIQALLDFVGKRWPEPDALLALRGLGSRAAAWAGRIEELVEKKREERQFVDDLVLVLLAVDEKRGTAALVKHLESIDQQGIYVVSQHLGFEPAAADVRLLSGIQMFSHPWPKRPPPGATEAVTRWVKESPDVVLACADAMLEFHDPSARDFVVTLQELVPTRKWPIEDLLRRDQDRREEQAELVRLQKSQP